MAKTAQKRDLSRVAGSRKARNPVPIKSFGERMIYLVCLLCALISIVTTFGILYILISESVHFFGEVSIMEYLTGTKWSPLIKPYSFGVVPLLAGTFQIAAGAALIALPLGLLSAIFLSEYASPKLRRRLKPILELLAGVPTVVYGYFALNFVTPTLQSTFSGVKVFNAASGAIVVGIMILPLVSSLCEDALSAVPRSLRDGAYALGATKLEVTMKIVVPAALSGVMAAFVLAISRAVGETMAVTLAAGQNPNLTFNPGESIQTMTAYIVQVSKGDTPAGTTAYYTIFAVGITLFLITSVLNMLAVRFVKKFRIVYT